jgi:hypothetical protein
MNSTTRNSIWIAVSIVSLALCGCSGMDQATFPAVPTQGSVGTIQGSVFGGHSPIVGAHVFLLEATKTGYATSAKSLIGSSAANGNYPVNLDATGTATNGWYYVTSDANGAFNVTGDYTCDVGYPVYFYAAGGSPNSPISVNITAISDTLTGNTYTYTFTASNVLANGQNIQFSNASLGGKWATLNGTTQKVLATPTTSSFKISTTIAPGTGASTQSGSFTAIANNPGIVNVAMLGTCPGVGNFTNTISYVFMNEVATAAMAYGMSAFATDGVHINTSTTNLIGLQNAALNVANLYNVQGAPLELPGNSAQGEGQIANQATVAGNGTAPQAELDTLGNILAACVDSSYVIGSTTGPCITLFADATTTGTPSGVKPTDIATAAINMAHNPGTANVVALSSLPTGTVPFAPNLNATPKDFTVAITYNNIVAPGGIAIDASGNAFVPSNTTSGYVTKLSPAGAVLATSATGGSGFDSVAVDVNGNVFVAAKNSNAVYTYTNSVGAVVTSPWTSPTMSAPSSVIVDSTGYVYVADGGGNAGIIQKFTNAGSHNATIQNACMDGVSSISIDPSNYLWADSFTNSAGCRLSNPGGTSTFALSASLVEPNNIAIDSGGNGWVALQGDNYLAEITSGGGGALIGGPGVGGTSAPTWIAIDGLDNVWFANNGNSYALSEFNKSGTAITPGSGYQSGNLNTPSFLAIDASGDVWVPNKGTNSVTELIGAASPVVTPLSAQQPGVRP